MYLLNYPFEMTLLVNVVSMKANSRDMKLLLTYAENVVLLPKMVAMFLWEIPYLTSIIKMVDIARVRVMIFCFGLKALWNWMYLRWTRARVWTEFNKGWHYEFGGFPNQELRVMSFELRVINLRFVFDFIYELQITFTMQV